MAQMSVASIQEHFGELTDPRRRDPTYPLLDMVVMTVCAVICVGKFKYLYSSLVVTKLNELAEVLKYSLPPSLPISFDCDVSKIAAPIALATS